MLFSRLHKDEKPAALGQVTLPKWQDVLVRYTALQTGQWQLSDQENISQGKKIY